jgi:hypothetical protein
LFDTSNKRAEANFANQYKPLRTDTKKDGGLMLRYVLVGIMLIALFGCLMPVSSQAQNRTQENTTTDCKVVVTQEPFTEEICQNVSKMEEVCENRELNYSLAAVEKNFVCLEDSLCMDRGPDGVCYYKLCSKGMTRCRSNITNLDPQKTGVWGVAANFSFDSGTLFEKNPVSKTLFPNETRALDFEQSYEMDLNQKKPSCTIFVKTPAKLQDCNFITKLIENCINTTKNKTVEKTVCNIDQELQ